MGNAQSAKSKPQWEDLFDPFFKERACASVEEEIRHSSSGGLTSLAQPLRRFLMKSLDAYAAEHWTPGKKSQTSDMQAMQTFYDNVERLVERLDESYPFDEVDAQSYAGSLRQCWDAFVREGSASRLALHQIAAREEKVRASKSRKPKGAKFSVEAIAKQISDQPGVKLDSIIAGIVATAGETGDSISTRTVKSRILAARSRGLLPSAQTKV